MKKIIFMLLLSTATYANNGQGQGGGYGSDDNPGQGEENADPKGNAYGLDDEESVPLDYDPFLIIGALALAVAIYKPWKKNTTVMTWEQFKDSVDPKEWKALNEELPLKKR